MNSNAHAEWIKSAFDTLMSETMNDPDIMAHSPEWRLGFQRGFGEVATVVVEMMMRRELILNHQQKVSSGST